MDNKIAKLKNGIKQRYGTLGEFCKEHEIGSSTMSVAFAKKDKEKIERYAAILKESSYVSESVITASLVSDIQDAIKEKYGSVRSFSYTNPLYSEQYVSCLLKGEIKRVSDKVSGIKTVLGIA